LLQKAKPETYIPGRYISEIIMERECLLAGKKRESERAAEKKRKAGLRTVLEGIGGNSQKGAEAGFLLRAVVENI